MAIRKLNRKEPNKILETFYKVAVGGVRKDTGDELLHKLNNKQHDWLTTITINVESLRSIVTVLTTSLVKKIENPKQDIRYHKKELRGGYSGRSLDTKFITPFFKKRFSRFAVKESGWLTRSIEQPHPFTLSFPGKVRNKKVKESFLRILDDVESNKANPETYLISLFVLLILEINKSKSLLSAGHFRSDKTKEISINLTIKSLIEHFSKKYKIAGTSQLPVIAIYSIYQNLLNNVTRYRGKRLLPLKSHVASDKKSGEIGDIEILDNKRLPFEGVEIKYGVPIDVVIVRDAYEKFKKLPIGRYYILTTAEPNIKGGEEENIGKLIKTIKKQHGCEVVVNGVIPSLKYYLRLLERPSDFIKYYSKNLKTEASKSTVIKIEHLRAWEKISKENLKSK